MCRILCSQLRLLTVHTKDMLWVLSTQVQKHTNRGEIKFLSNINSQQALVPFALCCYSVPLFFAQRYERYGSRTFQEMTRDTHTHTQALSVFTPIPGGCTKSWPMSFSGALIWLIPVTAGHQQGHALGWKSAINVEQWRLLSALDTHANVQGCTDH